jgi:hypothetical protein
MMPFTKKAPEGIKSSGAQGRYLNEGCLVVGLYLSSIFRGNL